MATATRKLSRNRKQSRNRNSGGGAGRIVGLLLAALLIGGGAYAYLNPDIIEQAKGLVGLVGLADPAAEETVGTGAPQAPAAPLITDAQAVEALNMAKVWVETRLAKGTRLNEINETIDVPAGQKAFWQSITLSQGAITAVPAGGTAERAVLLLPMQAQGQLIWACAGDIPPVLESSICTQ
ncbi:MULTISPECIES: hypothetical protein [Eikenella]|uniref:Uncharacterized protein n=1 Tax=Eikenella longinqua TaxID=1795827 RepID=A0A1A9RWX7_9NEIS|nr:MULTISPECIES: hypothetical protein [Eikenella]OAM26656.1 hypothetical protein A7P95_07765 [Eikenella longinqua]